MELTQNLIPEEKIIAVKDRQYKIKKLSIKQVLLLTKYIFSNIYQNKDKFAVFTARVSDKENKNNLQDALLLLELLEEQQIYSFIGILINEDDLKFIEENIGNDFDLCVSIVADVVEVNQKSNLKKNIQKIMSMLTEQISEQIQN